MAPQNDGKLARLRSKIDRLDRVLLKTLRARMKIVREIAAYKRANDLPLIQKGRWDALIKDRMQTAKKLELGTRFTKDLFNLIHREALRIQRGIKKRSKS